MRIRMVPVARPRLDTQGAVRPMPGKRQITLRRVQTGGDVLDAMGADPPAPSATPGGVPAFGGTHRDHLDGLRAVAVYLVVVFHAGADRLAGGFIGVDVFFVLSGFLVTQVLLRDVAGHNGIRFGRFYARRMRRLLPASVIALLVTAVVFAGLATPAERIDVAPGFRACFLYVANWFFIGRATSYFANASAQSPVLHFWSLAVEEQFYVVWPLLLGVLVWATARLGRHRWNVLRLVVLGAGLASAALAFTWRHSQPDRAYFGTDTRAYQLLAGAFLALTPGLIRRASRHPWLSRVAVPAGLLGIVVLATDVLTLNAIARGVAVTVVVAVLIVALDADVTGLTKRALSTRPMGYLGKVSYGTYLWHWPVIVIIGKVTDVSPLPLAAVTTLVATGIASLSYQLVEMPIRLGRSLDRFRWPVVVGGLSISLLAGLLVLPRITSQGHPEATSTAVRTTPVGGTPIPTFDAKLIHDEEFPPDTECFTKAPSACTVVKGTGRHILLMGDSNAHMWIPAFTAMAKKEHLTLSLEVNPGCLWQKDVYIRSAHLIANCKQTKIDAYKRVIPALHPDLLVLVNARESAGRTDQPYGADPLDAEYRAKTVESLKLLEGMAKQILIIEAAPTPIDESFNPFDCLAKAKVVEDCRFVAWDKPTWMELLDRKLANASTKVTSADLDRFVCPYLPICDPMSGSTPVFWDPRHITLRYSTSLAPDLTAYLRQQGFIP